MRPEDCKNIEDIRKEIDSIDEKIITFIGNRYKFVLEASKFKKNTNSVKAPDRVKKMMLKRREWAEYAGLDPDFIEELYKFMINFFIGKELSHWKKDKNEEIIIFEADEKDLDKILMIQKIAFLSEAEAHFNDYNIPPIKQSLEDIKNEFKKNIFLKAVIEDKITGSVRGYQDHDTAYINRLVVLPDYQNRGIGKKLMMEIENKFQDIKRFELFTGFKSEKNIKFYEKLGYKIYKKEQVDDKMIFVYFEKFI